MNSLTHTIAAVSTPPGKGGVALIRMSGEEALRIAGSAFSAASRKKIQDYPARTQIYGYIKDADGVIDDVMLCHFPAPASYTGEDTVEICTHGGVAVTAAVLELLFALGAVPAEAGEFTRRAFINGRLSLTEAEAIGGLLEAKSREQIRLCSVRSRGKLGEEIAKIRASLVDTMSSMYARIDYPDEDLGEFNDEELLTRLDDVLAITERLIGTYKTGRAVAEGVSTVICGKPNVGKSSLYNALLGEDAAIVTSIAGTTRDVLTRQIPLGRVMLNLADTAGVRVGDDLDAVERIGIEKSRKMMSDCELLFALFDISRPLDDEDLDLIEAIDKLDCIKIAVLNKCDSAIDQDLSIISHFDERVTVSARDDALGARIAITEIAQRLFTDEKIHIGTDAIISSARQFASLTRAHELISIARSAISAGVPQDAVSTDVERALGSISELDGKTVSEEICADIFSKFCVGK